VGIVGILAVAALVVYWVILNRTTLGYGVKAVGFNPEAARYGGISVSRNYVLAMAISGTFAGLAGAMDILGWQFHIATSDITASQIGFVGIAVALLGLPGCTGRLQLFLDQPLNQPFGNAPSSPVFARTWRRQNFDGWRLALG
jgi:ABC-type uncharacterized transport system permease subunit